MQSLSRAVLSLLPRSSPRASLPIVPHPLFPPPARPALRFPPFRAFATLREPLFKKCPNCGSLLETRTISCEKCGTLNPLPEDINYLSLFGFRDTLPFKFDLDTGALKREYLKLMSKVHPDSVRGLSEEQKRIAENVSATITHAYSTLAKPLSRAAYLLHHLDPPVPVAESSKLSDPELLMTVLEVREAIEDASDHDEIEAIKEENDVRIQDVQMDLVEAFREGRAEEARDKTIELRYWEGLRKACDDWEPGKRVELVHD